MYRLIMNFLVLLYTVYQLVLELSVFYNVNKTSFEILQISVYYY